MVTPLFLWAACSNAWQPPEPLAKKAGYSLKAAFSLWSTSHATECRPSEYLLSSLSNHWVPSLNNRNGEVPAARLISMLWTYFRMGCRKQELTHTLLLATQPVCLSWDCHYGLCFITLTQQKHTHVSSASVNRLKHMINFESVLKYFAKSELLCFPLSVHLVNLHIFSI